MIFMAFSESPYPRPSDLLIVKDSSRKKISPFLQANSKGNLMCFNFCWKLEDGCMEKLTSPSQLLELIHFMASAMPPATWVFRWLRVFLDP